MYAEGRSNKGEYPVKFQVQIFIRALPGIVPTQKSPDIRVAFFDVKCVAVVVFGKVVVAIAVRIAEIAKPCFSSGVSGGTDPGDTARYGSIHGP